MHRLSSLLFTSHRAIGGVGIVALTCVFAMGAGLGVTQAQTPEADETCRLQPLELPLFGATPVPDVLEATPDPAISGSGAVSMTIDEINDAVAHLFACVNEGDPSLAFAIFTEEYLASQFSDPEEHYLPAFEQYLDQAGEEALPQMTLVSTSEEEIAQDGRIAVLVTYEIAGQEMQDFLLLAYEDEEWLIDDVLEDPYAD